MEEKTNTCQRCGQCCMRGGPALHEPDVEFVRGSVLPLSSLYTIRPGERAYDNVGGGLFLVTRDIVKIKSKPGSAECLFYGSEASACRIYESRPLECRLQACWDTSALEGVYADMRLSRRAVLENAQWLCEMIDAHGEQCHFEKIRQLVAERDEGDASATAALTGIINYDAQFRRLAVEKGRVPEELLDFLFGKPLADILAEQFGVKVSRQSAS